jgi:hypothetical protein
MARYEVDAADAASKVRRARDTTTGRVVVLERGIRADRLRQLQSIPRCAAIAPFERVRDGRRLQLAHPAPLDVASPTDEFEVVQAIGSLLDGLAWLHMHGAAHGAVGALALTSGPTGGRLSLAGAFGVATATPQDDVYAASALARCLLVGGAAGCEVADDVRLEQYASPAVAEAIRAGLDPDAAQRPSAIRLATMVRGEFLLPISHVDVREPLVVRLHASLLQMVRAYGGTLAAIGTALAAVILVASLASADQPEPPPVAMPRSFVDESPAPQVLSDRLERLPEPTSTVAPTTVVAVSAETSSTTVRNDAAAAASVAPATSAPANDLRPTTTIAALPPPPPTTVVPTTVATTASTTTASTTTRSATTTTTRRATTTTTTAPKGKGKGKGDNAGGLFTLLDAVLP